MFFRDFVCTLGSWLLKKGIVFKEAIYDQKDTTNMNIWQKFYVKKLNQPDCKGISFNGLAFCSLNIKKVHKTLQM